MGLDEALDSTQSLSEEQHVELSEGFSEEIPNKIPVTDRIQSVFNSISVVLLIVCVSIGGMLIIRNKDTLFPEPEKRRENLVNGLLSLSGSDTTMQDIKDERERQHREMMNSLRYQQEEMRDRMKEFNLKLSR